MALTLGLAGIWPVLGHRATVIPAVPALRPSILSPFVHMHISEGPTFSFVFSLRLSFKSQFRAYCQNDNTRFRLLGRLQ
jgi:hypothetical protein